MDVRRVVARWQEKNDARNKPNGSVATVVLPCEESPLIPYQVAFASSSGTFLPITRQLHLLGLGSFEGRQHCGMDVCISLSSSLYLDQLTSYP